MGGRIVFIKSDFSKIGGLEKYTKRLAVGFMDKGYEVVLLTTEGAALDLPFKIVTFGKRCKSSLFHLLRFDSYCEKWLENNKADVVFGLDRNFCRQTYYRAGNGCHAAYLDHRKAFSSWFKRLTLKLNPLHYLICAMEKKTFESLDLQVLFTNSQLVKDEILHFYPKVDPAKIVVVHNGVEWKELEKPFEESLTKKEEIQHQLGLDPKRFQFLFIGNEYQRKGLALLLEALSLIKELPFQLSVVGKERNLSRYKKMAAQLGLQDKVIFFGQKKNSIPFYQAADCCVIPSYYDPFANVTVEALAMGLYVISSPKNGGSEVIANEAMGDVFSEFSKEKLKDACLQAMKHPKTSDAARSIRSQVAYLDFPKQLEKVINSVGLLR